MYSFKYAFPGRNEGEGYKSTNLLLSVSDNDIGISKNLDIENPDSLGLHLVTSLVEQINGELEIKSSYGTEIIIKFAVPEKNNRESASTSNKNEASQKSCC